MKDSQTPSTCFTVAPSRRLLERRLNGFGRIVGLVAALSVPLSQVAWANTAVLVTNGTTDLTTLGAGTTSDLEFQNLTYSPTAFNLTSSAALGIGTLDDLDATQSLTIADANGSAATITLSGGSNTVAPSASDLLYVASGGTLTLTGGSGTTALGLTAGASGNFDNAGTLNIGGALTITTGDTLTFTGNGATNVSGAIAGTTGAVTVNDGSGSVTFSGADAYTGATTINSGTLNLNFSASGAPATNIVNNSANSSALALGGGTLLLTGNASTTNSQRFNGTALNAGNSAITLNANATANPLELSLGAITRNAGSTVLFTLPSGTQSASNGIVTTTGNDYTNGVLGPWAIMYNNATAASNDTANGYTFASVSSGNIVPYTGATSLSAASAWGGMAQKAANGTDYDLSTAGTYSTAAINWYNMDTLRYTGAGLTETSAATTLIYVNAIMNAGTGLLTIGAGNSLNQSNQTTLGLDLYAETAGITISGIIANFGGAITVAGPNTVTLSGINTYTSATYVGGGSTLVIGGSGDLGSAASYAGNIFNAGTFNYNSTVAQTLSGVISGAGQLQDNGTGTLTLSGINTYTGGATVNSGATLKLNTGGANAAVLGNLTINSGGTVLLTAANALGYNAGVSTGTIYVNGGTLTNDYASGTAINMGGSTNFVLTGGIVNTGNGDTGSIGFDYTGSGGITTNASGTTSTWSVPINLRSTTVSMPITTALGSTTSGIDLNISSAIGQNAAGSGITKSGAGTLELSGVNTYTGATTINGGTLDVNSPGSTNAGSAVAVNNGGTLGGAGGTIGGTVAVNAGGTLGGTDTINGLVTVAGGTAGTPSTQGTITLANGSATNTLTLGGGLTLGGSGSNISQLNLEAKGASAADELAITGALTLNAGGADITINNLGINSGNNTYILATFSGAGTYNATGGSGGTAFATGSAVSIDGFTLTDPNLAFGITGMLDVTAASGGALELVTTGAAAPTNAYWSGAQGSTWGSNSGGNGNFTTTLDGGTFVSALPGSTSNVYFSNNGSTNLTNTLGGNFDIASLTFLGSANHNGAVTINADGNTLTLESGGITVQSGAGAVTIGSLVALDASQAWANAGSNNLTVSGAVTGPAGSSSTLTVTNSSTGATILNGVISNGSSGGVLALNINSTGAGSVVLGVANTFTGATTITAGTLQLSNANALQDSTLTDSGNDDLVFTAGIGTFTLGGLSGSGSESLTAVNSSLVNLVVGNNGVSTTYSGALSDGGAGGSLTKVGSGTLILAGANTYSGATTVSGGTLNLTGSVTGSNVTTSGTAIVNESSTGVIAGSGATFTQGSTGTSVFAGTNTYGGLTTINVGGTLQIGAGGTTGSLGSGGVTDNGTLAWDRTDSYGGSVSTVIGGSGAVNVAAGTLTLTGANTYSGATTIGSTAALTISGAGSLGSSASYLGTISDAGTFTYASSASQTLGGVISQGGSLIDNGAGTLTLTALNTYTGGTTVNSGATLSLDTNSANGNVQGTITVNSGGTLLLSAVNALGYTGAATATVNVNGGTVSDNVNGLLSMGGGTSFVLTGGSVVSGIGDTGSMSFDYTGSGGITTNASSTTSTWSVPIVLRNTAVSMPFSIASGTTGSGIDLTVSGGIGQNSGVVGGITKSGAGTLKFSGADTYTGATTVSQGTLIVAGSLSSSVPSVSSGANLEADGTVTDAASVSGELSGTGSVGGASVTGGTLAPGLSTGSTAVGTLTANGNVTLASSSIFSIRIGLTNGLSNDADQLSMGSSTFSLADGTTTLQTIDGAAEGNVSLQNTVYTIVSGGWSGGDGFFENADSQGAQFTDAQGYTYAVFYGVASGSTVTAGNDINLELVAVPEPQTWAMLLGGAAMLLLPRRSRRWNRSKN